MEMKKLPELCNITTGKLDANAAVENGMYPYFTCGEIPSRIDEYAFDTDAILLAGNNAQGNFHVSRYNGKFNAYQRTYVLTAKENCNLDYIYYSLKLALIQLKNRSQGSQTKFLTMPILNDISINTSLNQLKIATVLSTLDNKIALNHRINAKLEAMAKHLYDYWFVQFDYPDKNGKPYKTSGGKMVWNEVLKREIPEGWEVKNIFEASDVLYGYPYATEPFDEDNLDFSKKPYKIVRIRDIKSNTFSAKTTEVVDEKYKTMRNDLLVGMDGYFHMNFWFRNDDFINQRIVRLRKTLISTLILYFQISPFIKFKEEMAKGSTVGHLSDKDLKQLFVAIPNDNSISDRFDSILNMITKNNSEIQKLTKLRDRLLPLLMNGQVEVENI